MLQRVEKSGPRRLFRRQSCLPTYDLESRHAMSRALAVRSYCRPGRCRRREWMHHRCSKRTSHDRVAGCERVATTVLLAHELSIQRPMASPMPEIRLVWRNKQTPENAWVQGACVG